MRKGTYKYFHFLFLLSFLFVFSCAENEPESEVINIPCEPRNSFLESLDSLNLGQNLKIFAPSSSISFEDSLAREHIWITQEDIFRIAFGYCYDGAILDEFRDCYDYDLYIDGFQEIELPLVFNTRPSAAHYLYNTPFIMRVCQDQETLAALVWRDPSLTESNLVEFTVFLNFEKSNTLFSSGHGWARDENAFQLVKNIINTISKNP